MGKMLSRLICCDKVNEPQTEQILVYRCTEIEHFKTNMSLVMTMLREGYTQLILNLFYITWL